MASLYRVLWNEASQIIHEEKAQQAHLSDKMLEALFLILKSQSGDHSYEAKRKTQPLGNPFSVQRPFQGPAAPQSEVNSKTGNVRKFPATNCLKFQKTATYMIDFVGLPKFSSF